MRLLDWLRARFGDEAGFTLVELVTTCAVMGVVMAGTVNIFISGQRASSDGQARLTAQQNIQLAFTRLEYDARCASQATLLNKSGSNGAGVYLVLPSASTSPTNPCAHASGNVTWCVTSGSLVRTTGTTCSATTNQDTFISSVTSSTPFSCYSPVSGSVPQLKVVLGVNSTTHNSDAVSGTDYITLRNIPTTFNNGGATALPAGTITVGNTSLFPASGTLNTANGVITYTGDTAGDTTTSPTFTGATGGTGTLAAGASITLATGCA